MLTLHYWCDGESLLGIAVCLLWIWIGSFCSWIYTILDTRKMQEECGRILSVGPCWCEMMLSVDPDFTSEHYTAGYYTHTLYALTMLTYMWLTRGTLLTKPLVLSAPIPAPSPRFVVSLTCVVGRDQGPYKVSSDNRGQVDSAPRTHPSIHDIWKSHGWLLCQIIQHLVAVLTWLLL